MTCALLDIFEELFHSEGFSKLFDRGKATLLCQILCTLYEVVCKLQVR
jgi:hypothetical protein